MKRHQHHSPSQSNTSLPSVWWLMVLAVALSLIGLLFVFEASSAQAQARFQNPYFFVEQQIFWFVVGLFGMVAGYFFPSKIWQKIAWPSYLISLILMILVFIPGLGREVNGAARWIRIGSFGLQPVELLKFSSIIFFSSWLGKHQRVEPFIAWLSMPIILLFLQPDVGSLLLVALIACSIFFVSGAAWKHILGMAGIGGAVLAILIILQPYRLQRITTYINPESDPLGAGFHVRQLTIALGNGGWLGRGIGRSTQKFSYVPEASTDSIFSIVAEEVGYLGSLIILGLFFTYIWICIKRLHLIRHDEFMYLMTVGLISWISWQLLLNLSAVVALVPLTGVPLPFFSYGGTSLVMLLSATGVLARNLKS